VNETPKPTLTPAPIKTLPKVPYTAIVTDIGMFSWLLGIFIEYPVLAIVAIGVVAGLMYFGWWKRRKKLEKV
jgi:hypothetical protein